MKVKFEQVNVPSGFGVHVAWKTASQPASASHAIALVCVSQVAGWVGTHSAVQVGGQPIGPPMQPGGGGVQVCTHSVPGPQSIAAHEFASGTHARSQCCMPS